MKARHLHWCLEHQNYDWSTVILTDESYYQFYSNKVKEWCKKRKGKMIPKHLPAIMIWGGIGIRGTTTLHLIRSSTSSETYIEILGENLLVTFGMLYPDRYELQQDNARPHTSRYTKQWLSEYGI
jgi:hypothetical protein